MYQRGDDVIVEFAGRDHPGEIIDHHPPWIMCRIHIDPTWDYGGITARLDPTPTICVRENHVRHADK